MAMSLPGLAVEVRSRDGEKLRGSDGPGARA